MSIERVPDTTLTYYLVAFDKKGRERSDDPDSGTLSKKVLADLAAQPVTDVFLICHGWKGDIPAARDQYSRWITAMTACTADIAQLRSIRPGFRPMLVGLHWPSLPFGDEEFGTATFGVEELPTLDELVEKYADRIADTPAARQALRTIFESALVDSEPAVLPPHVVEAYRTLNSESGLGEEAEGAAPGADREPFDAETAYQNARATATDDPVSFGGFKLSGLLAPLQQLSFWQMKDRGRTFGETGGHNLLKTIQIASPNARVHLMGHSFGCIVVSAAVAGAKAAGTLPRPVDTLFLVQGALSFWSYCSKIEQAEGAPGYFQSILADRKVGGVTLATTSEFDTAVGRFYPLGAGVAEQVTFAPGLQLPKYGGLGTFGIQGPDTEADTLDMLRVDQPYTFRAGSVYNVNGNEFIRNGGGASGAHSDIGHAEVAHAFWQAIIARG